MDINQVGLQDDSLLDHRDYQTHRGRINTIIMTIYIILFILSAAFIYLFIQKE
jgi:hypothetical protein